MKRRLRVLLVLLVSLSVPMRTWGAAGDLDPTFGNGGVVVQSDLGRGELAALVLQSDGKLVGTGSSDAGLTLARYNIDGSLDAAFGNGGLVTTPQILAGMRLILQPDGKLLVGGFASPQNLTVRFGLARYTADGSLDPSFGTGGIITTPSSYASDQLYGLVLQPDGKIIAVGWSNSVEQPPDQPAFYRALIVLTRYNADGTLDQTFGTGGWVTRQLADLDYGASAVLQPDGKILVAGFSCKDDPSTASTCRGVLLRYQPDGQPDLTFGTHGVTQVMPGPLGGYLGDMQLQPDGKIVVVGSALGDEAGFALIRFNADGSLDASFGNGGTARAGRNFGGQTMVQHANGSLVVGGHTSPMVFDGTADFALMGFTEAGTIDRGFGQDGVVTTRLSPYDMVTAIAIQPGNKVVAGGIMTRPDVGPVWVVARYIDGGCGNGVVDQSEECDDGNLTDGDGCDSNCRLTGCGNAVATAGEECDDGNTLSGDGCDAGCVVEPVAQATDFTLQTVRPLRVRIARGSGYAKKSLRLMVTTTTPNASRSVTLTAKDGNCPLGTMGSPAPSAVTLTRKRVRAALPLTVRSAAFTSGSRKSPARCTAVVTATGSTGQQTTQVELNVTDNNDL